MLTGSRGEPEVADEKHSSALGIARHSQGLYVPLQAPRKNNPEPWLGLEGLLYWVLGPGCA